MAVIIRPKGVTCTCTGGVSVSGCCSCRCGVGVSGVGECGRLVIYLILDLKVGFKFYLKKLKIEILFWFVLLVISRFVTHFCVCYASVTRILKDIQFVTHFSFCHSFLVLSLISRFVTHFCVCYTSVTVFKFLSEKRIKKKKKE
jgi:hypothetical protein